MDCMSYINSAQSEQAARRGRLNIVIVNYFINLHLIATVALFTC